MSNQGVIFCRSRRQLDAPLGVDRVEKIGAGETRINLAGLRDYLRAAGLPVLTELAAGVARAIGQRRQIHTACAMWCAQQVAWSHGGSLIA